METHCPMPGQPEHTANCPLGTDSIHFIRSDVVQIKVDLFEKECRMKAQRPEDQAIGEFAAKLTERILKDNIASVNAVIQILLKQRWQVLL